MAKTGKDLVDEAKARIEEIDPSRAVEMHGDASVTFLDVREPNEWNLGHVPNAKHVPRGQLENKIEGMIPVGAKVVVYCAGGSRSALATDTLKQMGYDAVSLKGGFRGWVEGGGELED